jgi:hypothetical protein
VFTNGRIRAQLLERPISMSKLDVAETVLGFFGFDRTTYSNSKKVRRKRYEELREQRARDIETEMKI